MIKLYHQESPDTDKKLKLIDPILPKPPFRWIFLGPTGSGKTSIIMNIVFNKDWGYNRYFDEIYMWVGSTPDKLKMQGLIDAQGLQETVQIQDFKGNAIEDVELLMEDIKEEEDKIARGEEKGKKKGRYLFVLDDMVMENISHSTKKGVLDDIFTRGRHIGHGISVVISTQKYTFLNNNLRTLNASHITIMSGTAELDTVAKEHAFAGFEKRELVERIQRHIRPKYSFVTLVKNGGNDILNSSWKSVFDQG